MRITFKKTLLLIFLSVSIFNSYSQKQINQESVIKNVLAKNKSLKISQQEILIAKGESIQSNALFLPKISISHSGITTTNPLMAFGSKLNQEILTAADFNPALLNNPNKTTSFATKIAVEQPLINIDGYYFRKAAQAKLKATTLQSLRTKDYLILEAKKAYMLLQIAYKTVTILEKTQETVLEAKRIANNSFKEGLLQKADVLLVDIRVTEIKNKLQQAKSTVKNTSNYLSVLMQSDSNIILKPSNKLVENQTTINTLLVSENRADFKALQQVNNAYKNSYTANKMSFLPRLNAFGSYELYDNQIFKTGANGYLIGAALTWVVFDGAKRFGKTQKAKAAYNKATLAYQQHKSKSQLELNKAIRSLEDAKLNIQLTALGKEHAKEALRIRTNRFKQGLEKTVDVLQAETQRTQKELAHLNAIFQHNITIAYLQFLIQE